MILQNNTPVHRRLSPDVELVLILVQSRGRWTNINPTSGQQLYCDEPLSLDLDAVYYSAVQSQKAVYAYFASEQILPYGFAEHYVLTFQSVGFSPR